MNNPTPEQVQQWYNEQYAQHGENYMRPYPAYAIFLQLLQKHAPKNLPTSPNILDIACGTGYLLKQAFHQNYNPYGIDISEKAIEICKKTIPQAQTQQATAENLPFNNQTFHFVTCLGSLEHFCDLTKGIQEMQRVSTQNALFCIMVPNKNYWLWLIKQKFGTEQQAINELLLSQKQWEKLLTQHNFKIIKTYHDKFFAQNIHPFENKNPIQVAKKMVFKLIWAIVPLFFTYQFIFIAQKK